MKYLTMACLLCLSMESSAQNMIIHKSDGTQTKIALADITKLTFLLSETTLTSQPLRIEKLRMVMSRIVPNPFCARVEYSLSAPATVHIRVIDMQGKQVLSAQYGTTPSGNHTATWDLHGDSGGKVSPGPYLLSVYAGQKAITRALFIVQ